MTAKTPDGKDVFNTQRHYHPQATTCRDKTMVYGAQWKASYIRDTSIQPHDTKSETFEIELPEGVRTVDVTVELYYEINKPSNTAPIHTVTRRVSVD